MLGTCFMMIKYAQYHGDNYKSNGQEKYNDVQQKCMRTNLIFWAKRGCGIACFCRMGTVSCHSKSLGTKSRSKILVGLQNPPTKTFSLMEEPKMEKREDTADISVLFFPGCANILVVYAQNS